MDTIGGRDGLLSRILSISLITFAFNFGISCRQTRTVVNAEYEGGVLSLVPVTHPTAKRFVRISMVSAAIFDYYVNTF